jgi:hypothetical protein
MCASKENNPGASKQNIANYYFQFMRETHPSVSAVLEIFSVKKEMG